MTVSLAEVAARAGNPRAASRSTGQIQSATDALPVQPVRSEVVHAIRGRVRLRVRALRFDPELGGRIVGYLSQRDGVESARVNEACCSLVVTYCADNLDADDIIRWLRHGIPLDQPPIHQTPPPGRLPLVCGAVALGLSLFGAPVIVTGALLAVSAVPIVVRAVTALREEHQLSADALDAVAVGVLLAQGSIPAAALSATLIAGGELVRALTARRSNGALAALMAASGRSGWVLRDGRKVRVPADQVQPGETVVAYPGELLIVDGEVLRGHALVDQKALTGESTPVARGVGDTVFASTLVAEGKLYVVAREVGRTTRASRTVQLMEDAPRHETQLSNWARRFADRLVVPTFLLAGALFVATGDLTRTVSVLIIDFTTGIRVSAPTTVLATMTAAVHRDILVKGGRALEKLAAVDTLVFDKTGTLTTGVPRVVRAHALAPDTAEDEMLALAAAAEIRLTHPAAASLVSAARERHLTIPERSESHFEVGAGVRARICGRDVVVGSSQFLRREGIEISPEVHDLIEAEGRRGVSTVLIGADGVLLGVVGYRDTPRPEATAVVQRLRELGVRDLVMVTGDDRSVAESVARELGITQVVAGVFPEQKAEIVRSYQEQGRVVGVVGDGINDSPALAYADVSVSLKAASDVARETADVVLHGSLDGLPESIVLAREAMGLIRQNLGVVAVPNAIGMLLASLGIGGPVLATALNNGSSMAAALNGLRPLVRQPALAAPR